MKLAVESTGTGEAVVLLHGTPTPPSHLRRLAERLAHRRRTLVPALPGYGGSASIEPGPVARTRDLLLAALQSLRIERVLAVIGFSGGTYHAFSLACGSTLPVAGVVALAGGADFSGDTASFHELAEALRSGVDLRPILPSRMLSATGNENAAARAEVERWIDATSPSHLATEFDEAARAPDLRDAVRDRRLPYLARVGALDATDAVTRVNRLHAVAPHGEVEIVPAVGHALLLEDFEGTARSIERFLDGLTAQSRT